MYTFFMKQFRDTELTVLKERYSTRFLSHLVETHGSPLLVVDTSILEKRYKQLREVMPRVTPHYAVKCFPSIEAVKTIQKLSGHLDIATNGEIDMVSSISFPPERMVHTHPHKRVSDIAKAHSYGIRTFVFDCIEELDKLEYYKNDINLSLRISYPNDDAHIDLSYKFGVHPDKALTVAKEAKKRGFTISSLCFHVGSQLASPAPFTQAITRTSEIAKALEKIGIQIEEVDIGGGFPTEYTQDVASIEEFAAVINPLIDKHFKEQRIISEPGRYLAGPSVLLLTRVIGHTTRNDKQWVFLDDGAYGSYSDIFSGKMKFLVYNISELDGQLADTQYVVCGPTCDSLDIIDEEARLPKTQTGDILITPNIGAYSWALSTEFNSIPKAKVIAI